MLFISSLQYKFQEGSSAERASLLHDTEDASKGDIEFEVSVPKRDSLTVGSKVRIGLSMKNTSSEQSHKINVHITGRLCRYNGKVIGQVLNFKKSLTVSDSKMSGCEVIVLVLLCAVFGSQYLSAFSLHCMGVSVTPLTMALPNLKNLH